MGESHVDSANYEDANKDDRPRVTDFDIFLPWACKQYSIGMNVIVTKGTQKEYVSAAVSQKKPYHRKQSKLKQPIMPTELETDDQEKPDKASSSLTVINSENSVYVETLYDSKNNLVELKFLKNITIPQQVMKVVALSIPYQKHLFSITINSGLNMATLYEISKFLPDSNITELCLDGAFLAKANYDILLSNSNLKHLSLARCSINDAILRTITNQLAHPHPASKVLSALNLTSNRITDVGAKYIADMLRTNRQLSYLNLSGNMLSDEGGVSILDTLKKFPLGSQELLESRTRYMTYLKKKNEFIENMIIKLQTAEDENISKKKSIKKGKLEAYTPHRVPSVQRQKTIDTEEDARTIIYKKAERLVETSLGLFVDPFSPCNTESQDGVIHCFGNNTLCYLNLAYNNLTYVSVKKIHEVLLTQGSLQRSPRGLIKVVIEGNLLPVSCSAFADIEHLLNTSTRTSSFSKANKASKYKPIASSKIK